MLIHAVDKGIYQLESIVFHLPGVADADLVRIDAIDRSAMEPFVIGRRIHRLSRRSPAAAETAAGISSAVDIAVPGQHHGSPRLAAAVTAAETMHNGEIVPAHGNTVDRPMEIGAVVMGRIGCVPLQAVIRRGFLPIA